MLRRIIIQLISELKHSATRTKRLRLLLLLVQYNVNCSETVTNVTETADSTNQHRKQADIKISKTICKWCSTKNHMFSAHTIIYSQRLLVPQFD